MILRKTFVSWLISKEFFGFLVDFQRTLGFFVPFRENFWCLSASFRSFENDTVAPFKTIRLHFHETNIFYPSSDNEYGGPCHRESLYSSIPVWTLVMYDRTRWECPRVAADYDVCTLMESLYDVACLRKTDHIFEHDQV